MKQLRVLVLFLPSLALSTCCCAQQDEQGDSRIRFTGFDLRWESRTPLPKTIWTFRVGRSQFSPSLVSNLLEFAKLKSSNRISTDLSPAPFNTSGSYFYESPERKRTLGLCPNGLIEFWNHEAIDRTASDGAPSRAEAFHLATNYIERLGFSLKSFASRESSDEPMFWTRPEVTMRWRGGVLVASNTPVNTLSFARQEDGIQFAGRGTLDGCEISFGKSQAVHHLRFLWRKLEREKEWQCGTPETMVAQIRAGKANWNGNDLLEPEWIKSIIITNANVCYLGEDSAKWQRKVEPFILLNARAELAVTNIIPVPNSGTVGTQIIRTNFAVAISCNLLPGR